MNPVADARRRVAGTDPTHPTLGGTAMYRPRGEARVEQQNARSVDARLSAVQRCTDPGQAGALVTGVIRGGCGHRMDAGSARSEDVGGEVALSSGSEPPTAGGSGL